MGIETMAAGTIIVTALAGGVVYVARLDGTTRVLKAEIESLGKLVAAVQSKLDLVLEVLAARPQTLPRRSRQRRAGRGRSVRARRTH